MTEFWPQRPKGFPHGARRSVLGVASRQRLNGVRRARETGERAARKQGHPKGSKLDEHEAFLLGLVAEKDDVTLAEMQAQLRAERGVSTGTTTLWRFFDTRGLTFKKRVPTRPSSTGPTS